ncbi:MAG TPA: GNAT family N-acetyltransferase [Bacteroidia bacterium]
MIQIRPANIEDVTSIHELILELAVFEKAPNEVITSPESLAIDGFGPKPLFICFVAEYDSKIVGMSLCYIRFSTWKGSVLYLEDLIVTESYRGKGIGKALFQYTLNYSKSNGFQRLSWQVLEWNQPAIDFYKTFGANLDAEWTNAWIES